MLLKNGKTNREIGSVFGVSSKLICSIRRGRTWNHVGKHLEFNKLNSFGRQGSKNGRAKLNETTVSYIKCHLELGVAPILLAKYFKVTKTAISQIFRRLIWKHVKPAKSSPHRIMAAEGKRPIRLRDERLQSKIKQVRAARAQPTHEAS